MSNTGLVRIYNNTGLPVIVWDIEAPNANNGNSWTIPAGHNQKIGLVAPWCANLHQVRTKALVIQPDSTNVQNPTEEQAFGVYVFQNTDPYGGMENMICWIPRKEPLQTDQIRGAGHGPTAWANLTLSDVDNFVTASAAKGQNG